MKKDRHIRQKKIIISTIVTLFHIVVYYFIFSVFFDTPIEHQLKKSTDVLSEHVNELQMRYDTLEQVMHNLKMRDSAVFGIIFESTPYEAGDRSFPVYNYEDSEISELGNVLIDKVSSIEKKVSRQSTNLDSIWLKIVLNSEKINNIPSIQPINNPELTLLATSFGIRISPFTKGKMMHDGVDYAIPVGTAVFATADGVISKVAKGGATTGTSVTIDHENGYSTFYAFLSRASVRVGNKVRRGDIIAFSGDNGLSYAPHLHYKVIKDGNPVNPMDYMFMEIGPDKIEEFREISSHAMQAFD